MPFSSLRRKVEEKQSHTQVTLQYSERKPIEWTLQYLRAVLKFLLSPRWCCFHWLVHVTSCHQSDTSPTVTPEVLQLIPTHSQTLTNPPPPQTFH